MIELMAGAVAGFALGAGCVLGHRAWLESDMLVGRLDEGTRELERRVQHLENRREAERAATPID